MEDNLLTCLSNEDLIEAFEMSNEELFVQCVRRNRCTKKAVDHYNDLKNELLRRMDNE